MNSGSDRESSLPSRRRSRPGLAGAGRWLLAAPAFAGLLLPLTALGVTRFRFPVLGGLLGIALIALLTRKVLPGLYRLVPCLYLAVCLGAVVAGWNVLLCVHPQAPGRSLAAAAAAGLLLLVRLHRRRSRPFPVSGWDWGETLLLVGLVTLLLRLSWQGIFKSPGVIAALLVVAPMLYFRPGRVFLLFWVGCAVVVIYEWMGFMNFGRYTGELETPLPAGIEVEVTRHGDPAGMPGARFFQPGNCESTRDAFYLGEASRTYRLNPDGSETVFFSEAESSQNLVELCEENLAIAGSFEQKFILFADLDSGRPVTRLPLESHPTTMVLSPDRKDLFVGSSMPGMIFRIDLETRSVTRTFSHYRGVDPSFSGICTILLLQDRILGVYSSWFMADRRPGELFSLDRDLGDHRVHGSYLGAWGFIVPAMNAEGGVYLGSYDYEEVFRGGLDAGLRELFSVPRGYYYLASLPEAGLILTNHWTTGDILGICANDPAKRFDLRVGGMGRMLYARGRQVFTPTASGYLRFTFPPGICP